MHVLFHVASIVVVVVGAVAALGFLKWTKLRAVWWPVGAVCMIGFLTLVEMLPYRGISTSLIVCGTALLTGIPVFTCTVMHTRQGHVDAGAPVEAEEGCAVGTLKFVLMIGMLLGLLMPIGIRLTRERRIGWTFDGQIAEKKAAKNLTVFVRRGDGSLMELDDVSKRLWNQSQVGDHVRKEAGEEEGWLNGRRVRVVPPALGGSDAED